MRTLKPYLTLLFLVSCVFTLRLVSHQQSTATTIEELTNLNEDEDLIKSKLMLVKIQLDAANATISQNLYLPYLQDGRIELQKAE